MEAEIASQKRLPLLWGDVIELAFRFAWEEDRAASVELILALKECLRACEAVLGDVIDLRRHRGMDGVLPAEDTCASSSRFERR